jgi:hypothetical protein
MLEKRPKCKATFAVSKGLVNTTARAGAVADIAAFSAQESVSLGCAVVMSDFLERLLSHFRNSEQV